jgi:hypothetical protein
MMKSASRRALPKNLIRPFPYRIAKASGSGDLLSRLPVHVGARDEVDYNGGASSESAKPRSVQGVCSGSQAIVYIGAVGKNHSKVGHTHVTCQSRLQHPTIRERPELTS